VSSFLLFFAYYAGETLIENGAILREGYKRSGIIDFLKGPKILKRQYLDFLKTYYPVLEMS
ncbi:hypothetical protein, partial [Legionella israelensis]|uniref:hypothetical protein n=1 Tax=Legionella israelensis TaxID=454 RepID=UPI001EE73C41